MADKTIEEIAQEVLQRIDASYVHTIVALSAMLNAFAGQPQHAMLLSIVTSHLAYAVHEDPMQMFKDAKELLSYVTAMQDDGENGL